VKRKSFESAEIKNLDQIQEQDPAVPQSRLAALVMASFGGACIVFAALALMRSPESEAHAAPDPLSELAARSDKPSAPSGKLGAAEVTFPQVLTDQDNPTTAMATVRGGRGDEGDEQELPRADMPAGPPPATDKLPIVPLPAQDVLDGARAKLAPGDTLRSMASHLAREPSGGEVVEPGSPGGYQLQVSSFDDQADADGFALVLRRRGHRAHVEKAHVQGRGVWHRVRIGPFKYRRSAEIYRQDFEAKERMVSFVVEPPKAQIRVEASSGDADGSIKVEGAGKLPEPD
jgi:cell division septation protein DedD